MLFTCLPEGARIPGRFPGPISANMVDGGSA